MLEDIQRKVIKDKVDKLVRVLKFGLRTGEPYYVYVDPDDRTMGLETGKENRYLTISEEYFMFRYIGIDDDGMKRLARFEIVIQANEKFGFNFGDRNSFLNIFLIKSFILVVFLFREHLPPSRHRSS